MPRLRIGPGLTVGAAIFVMFACGEPLRRDEIECEEAVAHLSECCPSQSPNGGHTFQAHDVECHYTEGCGSNEYPSITQDDAACIRGMSCADLVAADVCGRVEQLTVLVSDSGAPPSRGVCP